MRRIPVGGAKNIDPRYLHHSHAQRVELDRPSTSYIARYTEQVETTYRRFNTIK